MQFEQGKLYTLDASKSAFAYDNPYTILKALYIGSYEVWGKKSHKFVHVLKDADYYDFLRLWSMIASNHSLYDNKNPSDLEKLKLFDCSVMETDIFEEKFEKGHVRII